MALEEVTAPYPAANSSLDELLTDWEKLGETEVFVRLAALIRPSLNPMFLAMRISDDATRNDLVIETALSFFNAKKSGQYDIRQPPDPYIHRIGKNLALEYLRKESRRQRLSKPFNDQEVNSCELRQQMYVKNLDQKIFMQEALYKLGDPQQIEIIVGRYFEEYSISEIAARLEISERQVRSRLNRAIAELWRLLRPIKQSGQEHETA